MGWKIGTGINTKFLRLGIPPEGSPSSRGWGDQQWMQPVAQGTPVVQNTNVVAPEDGFRWAYDIPGEEFLRRYEQVPDSIYPAGGLPSINGQVYLRWGVSTVALDNTHIEWRGWGYRKIKAKHGWGPDDLEATRVALLDAAPKPHPKVPGRAIYQGPEYAGRNGARCRRLVVVDHEFTEDDAGAPNPAGIITSFGWRIG